MCSALIFSTLISHFLASDDIHVRNININIIFTLNILRYYTSIIEPAVNTFSGPLFTLLLMQKPRKNSDGDVREILCRNFVRNKYALPKGLAHLPYK